MDSNSPGDLKTISMVSNTLGWAVGTWPPMVRFFVWNGFSWSLQESPQDHYIYALKMIDIDHGWCVGEGGVTLQKITGDFVNVASPTSQTLYAVSLVNGDSGFAVGVGGTIMKLNYTWSVQTSPTVATLYGVAAVSASDAWAVGAGGTVLHYDGTTWKKVRVNTNKTLYGVSFYFFDEWLGSWRRWGIAKVSRPALSAIYTGGVPADGLTRMQSSPDGIPPASHPVWMNRSFLFVENLLAIWGKVLRWNWIIHIQFLERFHQDTADQQVAEPFLIGRYDVPG